MLDFRKLDGYRYALSLLELTSALGEDVPPPHRRLAGELVRAALGVLRGLAEGSHREPVDRGEARHCYALARVSAFECVGIVDALERARVVSAEDAARVREVLTRLVAMLCRLEGQARGDLPGGLRGAC
jgi:four helix bundle protein